MTDAARAESRYTAEAYFGLVSAGVLSSDDQVELLEGVIVAMSPQNPPHASAVSRIDRVLQRVIGDRAVVRTQQPLVLSTHSVPEPDIAIVPGQPGDYDDVHPTAALLIVEVADSSLQQDRLTKASIYAAAGVPEYWIINLRADYVEVYRAPDTMGGRYLQHYVALRNERIEIGALANASIAVDAMLPRKP